MYPTADTTIRILRARRAFSSNMLMHLCMTPKIGLRLSPAAQPRPSRSVGRVGNLGPKHKKYKKHGDRMPQQHFSGSSLPYCLLSLKFGLYGAYARVPMHRAPAAASQR